MPEYHFAMQDEICDTCCIAVLPHEMPEAWFNEQVEAVLEAHYELFKKLED